MDRAVGAKTAFIEFGSLWKNGYCESFNSKLRIELLNGEIFYSLAEARIVIESWRHPYNTARPHSSLGYRPPTPEAVDHPVGAGQVGLYVCAKEDGSDSIRASPRHAIGRD